jgi:hypothetical protein
LVREGDSFRRGRIEIESGACISRGQRLECDARNASEERDGGVSSMLPAGGCRSGMGGTHAGILRYVFEHLELKASMKGGSRNIIKPKQTKKI